MSMESSSLEIKVMYGKDLKAFNFFQKLLLYVQASIISDDPGKKLKQKQKQQQRTPPDKEGDGNPEWNREMRFDLKEIPFQDCDHIFVYFEVKHEGFMFGDKTIGEVRVPLNDLITELNNVSRFVHYEVRTADGKPNGVLTFAYKINGNKPALGTNYCPGSMITGYTIAHQPQPQPQPQPQQQQQQASEIQYPKFDFHSSPPASLYPLLESQTMTPQQTYSTQPDTQYPPPARPHPHQESYYSPPPVAAYYPPPTQAAPPPPQPPAYPHPPPSPLVAHGAYYPPPPPPSSHSAGFSPWEAGPHMDPYNYNYSMPGSWVHSSGHSHSFSGESSPNSNPYGHYHHSSPWSGR